MITFIPLQVAHFPFLLTWLNAPHVMQWWPHDNQKLQWSLEDVSAKYTSYVQGYKLVDGKQKPIHAFIVQYNGIPIGYIQYYNAYDFPRGYPLVNLAKNLAGLNLFIGEVSYTAKGLGPIIINTFLQEYIWPAFDACFVDPEIENKAAIRAYEKCGFTIVRQDQERSLAWMVKEKP